MVWNRGGAPFYVVISFCGLEFGGGRERFGGDDVCATWIDGFGKG
jgi:hypothetical protein